MASSKMWIGLVAILAVAAPSWTQEAAEPEPPSSLSSKARIAPPDEPGEPLVISGQVFDPAGVHPVPNIVVYAYQTDVKEGRVRVAAVLLPAI